MYYTPTSTPYIIRSLGAEEKQSAPSRTLWFDSDFGCFKNGFFIIRPTHYDSFLNSIARRIDQKVVHIYAIDYTTNIVTNSNIKAFDG